MIIQDREAVVAQHDRILKKGREDRPLVMYDIN